MKSIIPLAVACAATFGVMTPAPAEAGGYRNYYGRGYSRAQYVHRPYAYSYRRPYAYSYGRRPYYYSHVRRPYYYPRAYVYRRPAYYYNDGYYNGGYYNGGYYPRYYAAPRVSFSIGFGGFGGHCW